MARDRLRMPNLLVKDVGSQDYHLIKISILKVTKFKLFLEQATFGLCHTSAQPLRDLRLP